MRAALLALALALAPAAGRAETVFVDAGFGEVGNAWLFGSRRDQSCWLAVPWHVIAPMTADEAAPFFFTDQSGRSGEAGAPVRVTRIEAALEAAGGNDDLAFAPVTAGVVPGRCASRLGLPGAGFAVALQAAPRLTVFAMQETTVLAFDARVSRITADAGRGSSFLVEPDDPSDRDHLQGGLSGGTVLMDWHGSLQPAGMVLSVLGDQRAAVVLRFDRVREAFEIVEAAIHGNADPAAAAPDPAQGVIAVTGLRGVVGQGSTPLAGIIAGDGCWRAGPPAGERMVELVLTATGLPETADRGLELVVDARCGPPQSYVVEARRASDEWVTISTACQSGPAGAPICRLPRQRDLELRLRAAPRDGWLGLSRIAVR